MEQQTQTTTTEHPGASLRPTGGDSGSPAGARRHWPLLAGTAAIAGVLGATIGVWAVNESPSGDQPVAASVLRQLERQRLQAQVDGDVATVDKLLAPDFTQVAPDGSLLSRTDALDNLATGNIDFTAIDVLGDITVHDYVDAAVLIYRTRMSLTVQGAGHLTHDAWDTVVYEQHDGHWQVRSEQTTGVGFLPPGA
jgi:hypothetical protein